MIQIKNTKSSQALSDSQKYRVFQEVDKFCKNGTIHGLRNIADGETMIIVRVIWILITLASSVYAVINIVQTFQEWESNPSASTLDPLYPVQNIPFPTITICKKNAHDTTSLFSARILNYVDFPCYYDIQGQEACENLEKQLSFLKPIFDEISNKFKTSLFERTAGDFPQLLDPLISDRYIFWMNGFYQQTMNKSLGDLEGALNEIYDKLATLPGKYLKPVESYLFPLVNNTFDEDNHYTIFVCNAFDKICSGKLKLMKNFIRRVMTIERMAISLPQLGEFIFTFGSLTADWNKIFQNNVKRLKFLEEFASELFTNLPENITLVDIVTWGIIKTIGINFPQYFLSNNNLQNLTSVQNFLVKVQNNIYIPEDFKSLVSDSLPRILDNNFIEYNLETFFKLMQASHLYIDNDFEFDHAPPKPSALDYLHFCGFVRELSESWSECFLFRPVSTPLGLCYSFNSLTFEEVYNSNEHSKAWKKVFDKGQDHATIISTPCCGRPKTFYIKLIFYENLSPLFNYPFLLSFSNPHNPFEVVRENYKITSGKFYSFQIGANQVSTEERFDQMDVKSRKCLLPHETWGLKYFRNYSNSACQYECALKAAEETCKCIPWLFPRNSMKSPDFCDRVGNLCYAWMLSNLTTFEECSCPDDCQSVMYSVVRTVNEIATEDQTDSMLDLTSIPYNLVTEIKAKQLFMDITETYRTDFDLDTDYFDVINKYISIVRVEIPSRFMSRSVVDTRTTFANQLSTLGGTLGLFLGMSLLSCLEILLALADILWKLFLKKIKN